ncbi:GxxExxY protein [Cerasicoccus maritimus]|uniref:GxxExxY protein n=1 Tax=Cerasicoccus maritimus TaxID=490089 RepID=UPI00285279EA|nr:GxxExxY protein [Cerasicoccus maritimus]
MATKSIELKDESYQIVGACFNVHNEMGSGFLESVYQECLTIEFERLGIPFTAKQKLRLAFRGQSLTQHYEADFVCFEKIIIEIKAAKTLADEHRAQILNYLKATGYTLGLLVNFGQSEKLEYERFVNDSSSRIRAHSRHS